jgi:hypothetical protein
MLNMDELLAAAVFPEDRIQDALPAELQTTNDSVVEPQGQAQSSNENVVVESGAQVVEPIVPILPNWEELTGGQFKSWEEVQAKLSAEPPKVEYVPLNEVIKEREAELYTYLETKKLAERVDAMDDESRVKLFIKQQYPEYTDAMVESEFQDLYSINEDDYTDTDKAEREKIKAATRLKQASLEASKFFKSKAENISLPEIVKPVQQSSNALPNLNDDPNAKAALSFYEGLVKEQSVYADGKIPFTYVDEAKNLKVESQVVFDASMIEQIKNGAGDYPDLIFAKDYLGADKDGQPVFNKDKWARDKYILNNLPKLLQIAAADGANQALLSKLKQDKNYQENINRSGGNEVDEKAQSDAFWNSFFKIPTKSTVG